MHIPRVLVLGATGRIGAILRKTWPGGRAVWQARKPQNVDQGGDWTVLDPLRQPEALARAASGCAAILCLAGVVPGSGGQPGDNRRLAEAAIRAGAASGAAVFLASSAAVYGNRAGVLDEATPLAPVNDYGRAKADMEARGAALGAELGVPVCALRIGNIAGVDAILGGWRPGFTLDRFKNRRTPRRSYIGVATLAAVLGELMGARGARGVPDTLNIASPGMIEMGALLDAAGLAWEPRAAREGAIAEVCLSTAALTRIIPLPETSADTLVREWHVMKEQAKTQQ